jgi:hypothetical protein
MNLQKALPVVTSILIILVVAVLRERSRTLAAIFAVMPINMPLALWVVFGTGDATQQEMSQFARTIFIGLIPGLIWVGVVFLLLRLGWPLLASILGGYAVWAVLIGLLFALGILSNA